VQVESHRELPVQEELSVSCVSRAIICSPSRLLSWRMYLPQNGGPGIRSSNSTISSPCFRYQSTTRFRPSGSTTGTRNTTTLSRIARIMGSSDAASRYASSMVVSGWPVSGEWSPE
jgi:hypothetical protein